MIHDSPNVVLDWEILFFDEWDNQLIVVDGMAINNDTEDIEWLHHWTWTLLTCVCMWVLLDGYSVHISGDHIHSIEFTIEEDTFHRVRLQVLFDIRTLLFPLLFLAFQKKLKGW